VAEGARLESVYTLMGIGGSNPSLSASILNTFYQDVMFRPMYVSAMRSRAPSADHQRFSGKKASRRLTVNPTRQHAIGFFSSP
jgi:hypothetical protein